MKAGAHGPRLIAWELTRDCDLRCLHCRVGGPPEDGEELASAQCLKVLDGIAKSFRPVMILTGGDPFLRKDLFEIARYGSDLGIPVVAASCGVGIDDAAARRVLESGIRRLSFSLDGARAGSHDAFRGVEGSFAQVREAMAACRRAGVEFQVNTTVTKRNVAEVRDILDLAVRSGARAFHPFFFVPTGKGRQAESISLDAGEYEGILRKIHAWSTETDFPIQVTCAPQYYRIAAQRGGAPAQKNNAPARRGGRGCMAGESFAFISATGAVKPCGFLDLTAGNLVDAGYDFEKIWNGSDLFRKIRDRSLYRGKCSGCAYEAVCGGCRARAHEVGGDVLGEEPFCAYGRP